MGSVQDSAHFTEEQNRKLEYHDMHVGHRKIMYLDILQKSVNEAEFRQLYAEAYRSKVTLSPADMRELAAEIETPVHPEQHAGLLEMAIDHSQVYEKARYKYFELFQRPVKDRIPHGSRQRKFWCDGPSGL